MKSNYSGRQRGTFGRGLFGTTIMTWNTLLDKSSRGNITIKRSPRTAIVCRPKKLLSHSLSTSLPLFPSLQMKKASLAKRPTQIDS